MPVNCPRAALGDRTGAGRRSGALADNLGMPITRQSRRFARFMLVWFALALGVAAASPLVQTQGLQLVCTASGVFKFVDIGDDGTARAGAGLQDCPLCILAGAPPPQGRFSAPVPPAVAAPVPVAAVTPAVARVAPPLPPRGPPAHA